MKKLTMMLFLMISILMITACKSEEIETPADAPSLHLTLMNESFKAIQLGTSWCIEGGMCYEADSPHPLQLSPQEFNQATFHADTTGEIEMQFNPNYPPRSISVLRWRADYIGQQELLELYGVFDDSESIQINQNNTLPITVDGYDYVYAIDASWSHGNKSTYTFRVIRTAE
jgi:hypothetical protein